MRGLYVSIGAVVLAVLLYVLFPTGLLHVLFSRGGPLFYRQPYVEYVLIILVLPGGVCLEIVAFVRRRRVIRKNPSAEPLRERIITERVLVVCPYCGAKNEQGITKCQSCDADL